MKSSHRVNKALLPKLLFVAIGGWIIANLSYVEAPTTVKIQQLQRELVFTSDQVHRNTSNINKLQHKLSDNTTNRDK